MRRLRLSDLATTPGQQQVFAGSAAQAKAGFEASQQQEAQAEINLRRTQVRSPVNGYATNLQMRVGDYAHQGSVNISIIDTDSYWIDGYFEETKLARVCIGNRVAAKLMGYAQPMLGHVVSVTRGIGVSDAAAGTQGLPNVNPVFTWVRLAQTRAGSHHDRSGFFRRPARLGPKRDGNDQGRSRRCQRSIIIPGSVAPSGKWKPDCRILNGPPTRSGCIPATTTERATPASLPIDAANSGATPEQINPGLVPSMNSAPRKRANPAQ